MQGKILLNHDENTKQVEEEEKIKFIKNVIEQLGIDTNEFWTTETKLSIDQRIRLRNILLTYGVQVIDDLDGNLQIYAEGELIGNWEKPTYKLKRDLRQLDPRKQIYLEMSVSCWTIFEQQENQ
jgi:hypothetical protein